ncbi:MAG: OmpA family protein, partial [Bryobacteraceae bacterium]
LKGLDAMPQANGEAKVEAKTGITAIEVQAKGLAQPATLGTEFLTYVLWSVSPEGRANNLGEIVVNKSGEGQLKATTQLQTFSLFVTAEPYFAVRQPSEIVILANELRKDTKGKIFPVSEYRLMRRTQYQKLGNPLALGLDLKNVPLEMYEARNAIDIARSREAGKYAPEIFSKAEGSLKMAENSLARKANKKEIISTARQTVQFSEDARALSTQKQLEERIANERAAAAAQAKAAAEEKAAAEAAEAQRKADAAAAEAKQKADVEAAEIRRRADLEAQRQAELTAAREAQMKAEADAIKAKEEAATAETERIRRAAGELRAQLLDQLNRILETRDTPRGLVVNMGDVLFDTGKYELRPEAREKLARLAGIVLAHPGLSLEIEGHTDSTGSEEINMKLSQQRADRVRVYLIEQGNSPDNLTAKGLGEAMPVADNDTAAGRQKNRRIEIIVSGEAIGQKIGA